MDTKYFSHRVTTGTSFVNRKEERRILLNNIQQGEHTWIMAPRRYGKTSLCKQVLMDLEKKTKSLISNELDFMLTYDTQSVIKYIENKIGETVSKLFSPTQKSIEIVKNIFKRMRVEINIDSDNKYQFKIFSTSKDVSKTITSMLLDLDAYATTKKYKIVLIFDEFQQLSVIPECEHIEGAIRHAAERVKSSSYIFSSSNRNLIRAMFENPSRPLYHMSVQLILSRIEERYYIDYLKLVSKKQWGKVIATKSISEILTLTELHSYYINALCSILWKSDTKNPPTVKQITLAWIYVVDKELYAVKALLETISRSQRKVLEELAKKPTEQVRSKKFLDNTKLAGTTVSQAINVLDKKDFIFKDKNKKWRVLDPCLKFYLNQSTL